MRGAPGRLLETVGGSTRAQKAPGRLQEALGRLWELKMDDFWGTPDGRVVPTRRSWDPLIDSFQRKPRTQCTEHRTQ